MNKKIKLKTKGDQSPVINTDGDVTVTYGISVKAFNELRKSLKGKEKVIERLLKDLNDKDISIENRDAQIHEWITIFNEIEKRLTERPAEDTLAAQAKEKLDAGDLEGAENILKKSLACNLNAINEKQKAAASDAYELGSLKELQLEYQEGRDYFKQAAHLDQDNFNYLNKYGLILVNVAEYNKAIEYFEKALGIAIELHGEKHPYVSRIYTNIGEAWRAFGFGDKAINYHEKALAIFLYTYGEKHPDVAIIYNNIGGALEDLGDSEKALEYYNKALAIDIDTYGENHANVAIRYNNIGSAWKMLGEINKSIEYFKKALTIDVEIYGEKHPNVAIRYSNIGVAWNTLGEHKTAIKYHEKALNIDIKIYGEKHPAVATNFNNIGSASYDLGESKKAIEYYEKALDILLFTYGEKHPDVATTFNNIGVAWYDCQIRSIRTLNPVLSERFLF